MGKDCIGIYAMDEWLKQPIRIPGGIYEKKK
jgi:hypothetical protein